MTFAYAQNICEEMLNIGKMKIWEDMHRSMRTGCNRIYSRSYPRQKAIRSFVRLSQRPRGFAEKMLRLEDADTRELAIQQG